jgi:vancomycin aglycone glucosyltransferase
MHAPSPDPRGRNVLQTAAWVLADNRPLPAESEAFFEACEPPVGFGLGGVRASANPAEAAASERHRLDT